MERPDVEIRQYENSGAAANDPVPITPDLLADLLKIEAPAGPLLVQGIAREVRPWQRGERAYVFGRLALGSASVVFRTSPEFAPQENEAVILKGILRIDLLDRSSRQGEDWRATHRVMLIGNVVGTWKPRAAVEPVRPLPVRDEHLSLESLLFDHGLSGLAILVSGTAKADITRMLTDSGVSERPRFIEANFGDASEFMRALRGLRGQREVVALAVARGGGTGQELIGGSREIIAELIEQKRPFYVALGHATDVALIDKYADQSFHAPSGLAAAIARAISAAKRRRWQERELSERTSAVERLATRLDKLEQNLGRAAYVHRHGIALSWPILGIVGLLAGAYLAWSLGYLALPTGFPLG